jgi:putative ABC transport system permease protein
MRHDLRLALRSLLRQRTFCAAALLTLGLGIGATTAMFAVVDGVLLRPLPYPQPDRLVQLSEVVPGGTAAVSGPIISNLTIHAWNPQRQAIGPIAHFAGGGTATVGDDIPRRLVRAGVGPLFFDVLGVHPVVGRFFREEDAANEAPAVVVLSAEFWREGFGADAAVVGKRLTIDDRPHEIIGVAPPGISIPNDEVRLWTTSRVLSPVAANGRDTRVELTRAIARLAPGHTTAQASAEGTALARSVIRPIAYDMLFGKGGPVEVNVRTLSDQLTLRVRSALLLLLFGVGLLLLITCANVANLFLSRGAARDREYAVRVALGAARTRLVRETLAETLVLSAVGGMVGTGLAALLVNALPAIAPADFPRLDSVALDWRALAFAIATTLASGLMTGLAPAAMSARTELVPSLRNGTGASMGPRSMRPQRVLLVSEAALAMMLLVGAALMGRSFVNLMETDAGYDVGNVLTARIYLPGASRGEAETAAFVGELLERVRAMPGVVSAGASNMAPFGRSTYVSAFEVSPPGREKVVARAQSYVVTPGYVEALKLRLRQGRLLQATDATESGPGAVLVNEEFVRLFLGGTDPLRIHFDGQNGLRAIVGVIANVLRGGLDQQPQAEIYVLAGRGNAIRREIYLLVRTIGDPAPYANEVRQLVSAVRSDAAVEGVEPLTTQLSASVAQPRFAAAVLLSLAGVALLLASIGLYGALSYWVARRQREIGIRSALGATTRDIVRSILREGVLLTGLGLGLGGALAAATTRLMRTLLVGVGTLDPLSFVAAGAALLAVAIVASALPAHRATRVDAVIALRTE